MTLARAQGTGTGSRQHWLYGARLLARLRPPVVALNLSSGSSLSLFSLAGSKRRKARACVIPLVVVVVYGYGWLGDTPV
jgi:hypothetical protein